MSEGRYARQNQVSGWNQERLQRARVLVAGAGALGNEVIKALAMAGVGEISIVDCDLVELSNLPRTVLFRESDVGRSKAEVAARSARELNPDCSARAFHGDLEFDVGLGVYRAMDLAIGCLDSVNARLALNRACARAGIPWIDGGIEPALGEVALYGSSGSCYECAMSPEMWANRNRRFSCGGLQSGPTETGPTTGTAASIVAGFMAHEALARLCSGIGEQPAPGLHAGEKIYITLRPYSLHLSTLTRDPECQAHEMWSPIEVLPTSPRNITAAGIIDGVQVGANLELGFDLLVSMCCAGCGAEERILKPLESCDAALSRCTACAGDTRAPVVISRLDQESDLADLTLAELGVPEFGVVALKSDVRRYIQLSGEYQPGYPQ